MTQKIKWWHIIAVLILESGAIINIWSAYQQDASLRTDLLTGTRLAELGIGNGVGVDAESKKHLFQRGLGKHTGYGLYLMREILSISGITILKNGEPDKGARFEMAVPKGAWRTGGSNT